MRTLHRFLKIIIKDKTTSFSCLILLSWLFIALFPVIEPNFSLAYQYPKLSDGNKFPDFSLFLSYFLNLFNSDENVINTTGQFILGSDKQGNSLAILVMNGATTSFKVSFFTVFLCLFIGIPLGALAGYHGGIIDIIISRIIDILLSFPPLILPITITAFFGGGLVNVIFALSITGWVSYARLVRGQFLSIKERDFVIAAKSLGATNIRIMFKHILANSLSPIAVQSTFALAGVIISEAGLSFLGLGVSISSAVSWGTMLNDAKNYLTTAPYLAFIPAFALFSLITSLNFIGEALRLAFDPKSTNNFNQI